MTKGKRQKTKLSVLFISSRLAAIKDWGMYSGQIILTMLNEISDTILKKTANLYSEMKVLDFGTN